MLARYPSTERFIRWYRRQIERIEAGELSIPAHLVYEDEQLDLPRQPGPDAASVEELRWCTTPVRLELTIWRPYEFSQRRYADWIEQAPIGTKDRKHAFQARARWKHQAKTSIYADPRAYFIEVHAGHGMPWFIAPVVRWFARLGQPHSSHAVADGGKGMCHAGVGTPEERLVTYLGFVTPVRVYVVKNPDGTPKRDPATNRIVTDVIVEQRLLRKGRRSDDLQLQYDVSAARVHLQEMTSLLKAAHGGQVPIVPYDLQHPKAEQLGAERYLFQWNGRHMRKTVMSGLIRMVLDGIVLVDRSGERIEVTSHLLRHTAATVQRQQYGVPLEILAEAMGHTLTASGQAPEATRYYSQMTETQKAEIRHDAIVAIMDDARLAVRVVEPDEEAQRIKRLMVEADEHTREVLERYGGLHPVTFGHCGYPGLCVRGTARAFCIGCPFLVRRPEYLDRVEFFLDGYVKAADAHERMGDLASAHERKPAHCPTQATSVRDAAAGRSRTARQLDAQLAAGAVIAGWSGVKTSDPEGADPFAHLKRQAAERSDRTVERIGAGIAALRAGGQKITAESLKQATHELEPGFAGLSFQVIRRNARAYALYREAADAFSEQPETQRARL